MVYSSSTLSIFLISNKTSSDDTIRIRKNLEYNEFEVTYTEHQPRDKPLVYKASGLYREKVAEYIRLVLKNQFADDEGYDQVQVNVPAMPRIILSANKISECYFREHLEDVVLMGLDLLDNTELVKKNVAKQVLPTPSYTKTSDYENHNYYPDDSQALPSPRSSLPGTVPQHLFWDQ